MVEDYIFKILQLTSNKLVEFLTTLQIVIIKINKIGYGNNIYSNNNIYLNINYSISNNISECTSILFNIKAAHSKIFIVSIVFVQIILFKNFNNALYQLQTVHNVKIF